MIGGIDPNELVYSFVAIQFPTTAKASDSAPNLQRFQNTMRQSIFFLVSELQMMWCAESAKGARDRKWWLQSHEETKNGYELYMVLCLISISHTSFHLR